MVRSESTSPSTDKVVQREGILSELVSLAKEIEISQGRGNLILLVVNEPSLRGLAEDFIRNRFESKKVIISKGEQISRLRREKGIDVCLVQLPESVGPPLLNALNYRREVFYETGFPNVIICNEGVLNAIVREAPDFWRYKASYHILQGVRPAVEDISDLHLSRSYNTKEEIIRQMEISDYLLKKATNDSQKAFLFSEKANLHYMLGEYEEADEYYSHSLEIYKKLNDLNGIAQTYLNFGALYGIRGDYEEALSSYQKSLEIAEELGDKRGIASALQGIGNVHHTKGDYEEALSSYEKSLEIAEELGDKRIISQIIHNIGIICQNRENPEEALSYYEKSLKIKEELGDRRGIAFTLHQVGNVQYDKRDYEEALSSYKKSLEIAEELGDKRAIGRIIHNIGNVQYDKRDYEEALSSYKKSLEIAEELGDKEAIASALSQMSKIYSAGEEFRQAIKLNTIAYTIFKHLKSPQIEITISEMQEIRKIIGEQKFNMLVEEIMPEARIQLNTYGLQRQR